MTFAPPGWLLRNAHLQSILPTSRLRRSEVLRRARTFLAASRPEVLDCGGGVRLQGFHAAPPGRADASLRLVVLLHGWEGSADSLYVVSLGAHLHALGYAVFRLNFRDHGGSHPLNPGLFHSCRLDEVAGAVAALQARHPHHALAVGGFSLGGNFALRVAARAPSYGLRLARAFAICPVLRPRTTMERLERGWFVYRRYFLAKWKRSLRLKQGHFPALYDLRDILAMRTLTAMTERLVGRYSEYRSLDDYLEGYSLAGATLAGLSVRSHVLLAKDDPIIPVADLANLHASPLLEVDTSDYGGHCGFLSRFGEDSWANGWVSEVLARPTRRPE